MTNTSGSSAQVCRLHQYEEALGTLKGIQMADGYAVAEIGPVTVALPAEIGERLNSFIGQRVGVLRTECDYRMRIISAPESDVIAQVAL